MGDTFDILVRGTNEKGCSFLFICFEISLARKSKKVIYMLHKTQWLHPFLFKSSKRVILNI